MKVFVAEGDLNSRQLLLTTLREFGHHVVDFENAQSAWEAFDREPCRVIVSDWLMPELDGLDLCRKVRQRPETEYTYFILLTANAQGQDAYQEAIQAGVDDFLCKPLDRDQIWMRLRVAERILRYSGEVSSLTGMLPICSYCKKVRDDDNYWQQVETFMAQHLGASFSHGICPSCYDKNVRPEVERLKASRGGRASGDGAKPD